MGGERWASDLGLTGRGGEREEPPREGANCLGELALMGGGCPWTSPLHEVPKGSSWPGRVSGAGMGGASLLGGCRAEHEGLSIGWGGDRCALWCSPGLALGDHWVAGAQAGQLASPGPAWGSGGSPGLTPPAPVPPHPGVMSQWVAQNLVGKRSEERPSRLLCGQPRGPVGPALHLGPQPQRPPTTGAPPTPGSFPSCPWKQTHWGRGGFICDSGLGATVLHTLGELGPCVPSLSTAPGLAGTWFFLCLH